MSDFDNDLFESQIFAHDQVKGDVGAEADIVDGVERPPSIASLFTRIMMGDLKIQLPVRNAVLEGVAACMAKENVKYQEWLKKREDLDEKIVNALTSMEGRRVNIVENFKTNFLAPYNIKMIHIDDDTIQWIDGNMNDAPIDFTDEYARAKYAALIKRIDALTVEIAKEQNATDLYVKQTKDQLAAHKELHILSTPLLRAELLSDEIVGSKDEDIEEPDAEDCQEILSYMQVRFELPEKAEPLLRMTKLDGSLSDSAELLAVLYGAAEAGVTVASMRTALELSEAAFRGLAQTSERASIGDKFTSNTLFDEIAHCNKIIGAGFHPMRWREAFRKSTSGMAERMLNAWVTSGYRSLTLAQLHTMFLPAIGSGGVLSLSINDEQQDPKENKLLSAIKDIADKLKAEQIEALGKD